MEALVIHAPGDLRVETYPTPPTGAGQLRVRVRCGGICGSDLHYYQHGGFGTVRIQEPMVLGHEVAGVVEEAGPDAGGFAAGDRVAISPSRPCGLCRYCQQGLQNHCLDMRYYGSAMRTPHVQGAFRQEIVVEHWQAHRLADSVSDGEGSMAEPLSVALHAVRRAGPLLGKRVLVTGCGPIGALAIIAARRAGAARRSPRPRHSFVHRTRKWSRTRGVTSASDHSSRAGASTPQSRRTPSESSRCREPWLPPPT